MRHTHLAKLFVHDINRPSNYIVQVPIQPSEEHDGRSQQPPQKPSYLRTSRWANAFRVASIRSRGTRSGVAGQFDLSRVILMARRRSNVFRVLAGAVRTTAAIKRKLPSTRLADLRGNHRGWWRISMATRQRGRATCSKLSAKIEEVTPSRLRPDAE